MPAFDSDDAASICAELNRFLLEQKLSSLSTNLKNLQLQYALLESSLNARLADLAELQYLNHQLQDLDHQLQDLNHQLHLQSIGKDGEIESLITEFYNLQSQHAHLQSSLDDRLADLAEVQALKYQLHLQSIGKDGEIESLITEFYNLQSQHAHLQSSLDDRLADLAEIGKDAEIERLRTEVSELHNLVAQKDLEISEKNATINAYLDKIVNLTGTASEKEAEFALSQAMCTRLSQEKELIEKHNTWLNDELKAKVDVLVELHKAHADFEEDMSAELARCRAELANALNDVQAAETRAATAETRATAAEVIMNVFA